MFDQHEVIFAEGAPSESLLTRDQALLALDPELRAELLEIFPELVRAGAIPARDIPKGRVMRRLVQRHRQNAKPVLQY